MPRPSSAWAGTCFGFLTDEYLIGKLAERKLLISESPFRDVDFLEEHKQRRRPHILTFEEEDRVLNAAVPHIRALAVLILEMGMRSRREALSLLWSDVDFVSDLIRVRESKTRAGERTIPISDRCKIELLRWRSLLGPDSVLMYSPTCTTHLNR